MSDIFVQYFNGFENVFSKKGFDILEDALDDFLEASPLARRQIMRTSPLESPSLHDDKLVNIITVSVAFERPKRPIIYVNLASHSLKIGHCILGILFNSNSPNLYTKFAQFKASSYNAKSNTYNTRRNK